MKILHVAETVKGGVATIVNQIVNYSNFGEHFVLIPENQSDTIKASNFFYFRRSGRNVKSFYSLFKCFVKTILKLKPDIVHIHSTFAGVICRVILFFMKPFYSPVIIYCPHAFSFMMDIPISKKRIYIFIEKLLSRVTDRIICTSKYEKNIALKSGLLEEKLIVIYNSVQSPLLRVKASQTSSNEINAIFIGRFDYQKGFDLILKLAKEECLNINIRAIGGYVNDKNKDVIPENLKLTGWLSQSEIANYLVSSDVLIMPSRWESFGLVAIEAQSYGIPVIASDNTAIPEVVINNKTGYLFETNNYEQLKNILEKLNKEILRGMAMNCKSNYSSNFRTEVMINNIDDLYTSCMSENHGK